MLLVWFMTGIELVIGERSIKAALKDGVVSLLIDGSSERLNLYFFGLDGQKGEVGEWLHTGLKEGDKLDIRILDVAENEVSGYREVKMTDDLLLLKYQELKRKLEQKKLI